MGMIYRDHLVGNIVWIGDRTTDVGIMKIDAAPVVSGDNATGKDLLNRGSILIDEENGNWYNNTGTKAAPIWKNMTGSAVTSANAISTLTIDPVSPIESDNEPVEAVLTAELDEALAGIPITFTTDFVAGDFESAEEIDDFVGAGYVIDSDVEGKASLTVVFSNDVDKGPIDINADISDTDKFVETSDTETIAVTVDTSADD